VSGDFSKELWKDKKIAQLTGGHNRSGGRVRLRLKSLLRRDLVSCWTDLGSLKSSWPFGFRLLCIQQLSLLIGGLKCKGKDDYV
jgi:hypothetical protein